MSTIRKVTSNTLWQIAGKAINVISGLIIIRLVTQYFGEEGTGLYTLVIGYIAFFFMPVDFGLNAVAVKHLLDESRSPQKIFRNLLGLRLTIGTVVTAIALLILVILPYNSFNNTGYSPQVKFGITLQIITILAQAILATSNAYFQANHKYKYSFISNAAAALFNTILVAFLIISGFPLIFAIAIFSISGLIGAGTSLYLVKIKLRNVYPLKEPDYWKELFSQTLPLTISILLNLVYFRSDALIQPFYRQLDEVGHYNVAYKIFEAMLVIPSYFVNSLYPVMLEKFNQGGNKFKVIIRKSALSLGMLSLCASITTYALAPYMTFLLLKSYETQTILLLRILSSGLIFFFLSSIATWALIIIGKQKYLAYIYAITMIVNISLNLIFIPQYGALASAIITISTEAIVLICTAWLLMANKNNLTTGKE